MLEGESNLQARWEDPRESDRIYSLDIKIADLLPILSPPVLALIASFGFLSGGKHVLSSKLFATGL